MILAAHQPMFMPALSYFYKIAQADVFVLADDLQYSTRGNFNRCAIKTVQGKTWLTVPVLTTGKSRQRINKILIDNHQNWQQRQIRTLTSNYRNSPYFDRYGEALFALINQPWQKLLDLNSELLFYFKDQLFLKTQFFAMSRFAPAESINHRIIAIMQQLNCQIYLVEEIFRPYLDLELFDQANLMVKFFKYNPPHYYQQFAGFLPNLSIIDLLFNEGGLSQQILLGKENVV